MDFLKKIPVAITITNSKNEIIYMNDKSIETFSDYGGEALLGTNLLSWHNQNSQEIINQILQTGNSNSYTIEKNGKKKFIHQTIWKNDNEEVGLIEFSFEVPFDLPHFVRG